MVMSPIADLAMHGPNSLGPTSMTSFLQSHSTSTRDRLGPVPASDPYPSPSSRRGSASANDVHVHVSFSFSLCSDSQLNLEDPLMRDFERVRSPNPKLPPYQRKLSIREVLGEMSLEDKGDVVNLIDIPQPDYSPPTMPDSVRFMDHMDIVLTATERFFPPTVQTINPHTGRGWHLLGSQGADTLQHHDASGLPTAVQQTWGWKLWIIVHRDFGHNDPEPLCSLWSEGDRPKYDGIKTCGLLLKPGDIVSVKLPLIGHSFLNLHLHSGSCHPAQSTMC